ncbi:glycoside hydrolase family 78 protein [Macroventuria anomochaeta]|uniref:Glycoside hydrolase family 78 protein n=1 Tax=Macroventuria anomochaeta TaxID=301207 RepID=A0ACB6S562_9PLEO|nr:glycoside hydrolase family 78 protein [Macroventuria anomochaeta]KAF2628344.1 glycoside hydrolase family 78 protein [Macroventuria anomochaeta]
MARNIVFSVISALYIFSSLSFLASAATKRPWDAYNYSPASRTVKPVAVHSQSGNVTTSVGTDGTYHLTSGSRISLDFGVEVGGWINLNAIVANYTNTSTPQLSLAFAESPAFVRAISDDTGATPTQDWDQALNVTLTGGSTFYTIPTEKFRGGFRFLTINALARIEVSNITCTIGFAPHTPDLRNYGGHFYTPDDDLLMRTWYAGAYTVQTNIAPKDTGRWLPQVRPGWAYNNSIGVTGPILVDGAKRDRAIWPGDLGIQGATAFLALGGDGLESVHNALDTLFFYQNATTGRFPFAGPATGSFRNGAESDTYHAWSLIAMHNYAIWTSDFSWLETHWSNVTRGLEFILRGLDNEVGLHIQTRPNDWARQGGGGYNSALNALDYAALSSFSSLAASLSSYNRDRSELASNVSLLEQSQIWSTAAARLKAAYNTLLWDPSSHLYRDNTTTSLFPQDGNALALLYNLTSSPSRATALSTALTTFHGPIGPLTPELPDTISPFVSSIEVLSHFAACRPARALNLTRTLWGYLLDSPLMTGSTLAEGLSANGSLYYRGNAGYKSDASYTSLSHGWSSGPTVALTSYVAGLEIVGWKTWTFAPQSDGLIRNVDAAFWGPMGTFAVRWTISNAGSGGRFDFSGDITTPVGMRGTVELVWKCEAVEVDGEVYRGEVLDGGGERRVRARGCVGDEED